MEKFLSFIGFLSVLFQWSMLTVLTLLIWSKNPVIANFTEAKRNGQDAKKKLLHFDYCRYTMYGKLSGSILSCFKLCELGVISVLVNTIPDT